MIQIYKPENTGYEKNGDMPLFPTTATVHAVLNGEWEVTLEHPIDEDGRWKYIIEDAVVKMPSFNGDQLFRVKRKEKSDDGITAEMQPIFMDAKDDCFLTDVRPTEKTGQQALDMMTEPNKKYSARSNITNISTAYYQTKNLIEAISAEDENSFINRWGGEVIYDNYTIVINDRAGDDYGYEVLYGKNIPENGISEEIETRDIVTRIVPKAYNGNMIEGDAPWIDSPEIEKYPTIRYGVMEFEDVKMREDAQEDDEEDGITVCDTQEQLEEALKKKCEEQFEAGVDKPTVTLSVDIVMLEGTDLYKDFEDLTKVSLGDTVHCRHSKLNIVTDARVIELEWDCLEKRVDSVVVGEFQYNYIDDATSMMNRVESAIRPDGSVIGQQVKGVLNAINTQLRYQKNVAQTQDVRAIIFEDMNPDSPLYGAMCLGTQGFQIADKRTEDGRDWDWSTAFTAKGGYADVLIAGILADKTGKNFWNLDTGEMQLSGILKQLTGAGGMEIRDGAIRFLDAAGNTLAIMHVSEEQVLLQGTGELSGIIRLGGSGNGDVQIVPGTGGKAVIFGNTLEINATSVTTGGASAKTGRAEFSNGTYLEFKNGMLTGGNTSGGSF